MSVFGIQGKLLELTVVECSKLKDTEWISRQDPYVCLEYASTKFRTRTCTDGGKHPKFQEKFVFTLIEGLREINVVVWNSNTVTNNDFIGCGKIQLQDVLSRGYDDRSWPLQTKSGRYAGEVKLIMHYEQANKPGVSYPHSAPLYIAPQTSPYSVPPSPYSNPGHPAPAMPYPPYPPSSAAYPPVAMSYASHPACLPHHPYVPPPDLSMHPPPPYPPPTRNPYPPPPHAYPYVPPGQHGIYPPPPY